MRAIVTGMIATYPVGGVAWDYGQYAMGLERMGMDVYYLEDTGWQTYDPRRQCYGDDCSYGVGFLAEALPAMSSGLADRWHFRAMDGRTFGIGESDFEEIVAGADIFLNVSGGALLRNAYMACPRKILIDTDPGWNHFVNYPKWDTQPGWQGTHGYRAHDHFFTYAELIGRPGCRLPSLGIDWQPTRPPVVCDAWQADTPGTTWTTVMTWNNFREPVEHQGVLYGSKEREFGRIEPLPQRVRIPFEVAVGGTEPPTQRWDQLGWSVTSSETISRTIEDYRAYIQRSRGEFSVAKNLYTATRSGWFSCRSVCYLAAGRPVVLQDTGFSEVIPTGMGIYAFRDLDEAVAAVEEVERDYGAAQEAARDAARRHFGHDAVLGDILARVRLE